MESQSTLKRCSINTTEAVSIEIIPDSRSTGWPIESCLFVVGKEYFRLLHVQLTPHQVKIFSVDCYLRGIPSSIHHRAPLTPGMELVSEAREKALT